MPAHLLPTHLSGPDTIVRHPSVLRCLIGAGLLLLAAALLGVLPAHSLGTAAEQTVYLPVVLSSAFPLQVTQSVQQIREVPKCASCPPYTLIYGTLTNIDASTVYSATLEVQLFDESGTLLHRQSIQPALVATFPQGMNSFALDYPLPAARHTIALVTWSRTYHTDLYPVTVLGTRIGGDGFIYNTVQITVRNDQPFTLYNVRATAVLSQNEPAVFPVGTLAPGEVREKEAYYLYSGFLGEAVQSASAQGAGQP